MSRTQLRRLDELEAENQRLQRTVSDLTIDSTIPIKAAQGNLTPGVFAAQL